MKLQDIKSVINDATGRTVDNVGNWKHSIGELHLWIGSANDSRNNVYEMQLRVGDNAVNIYSKSFSGLAKKITAKNLEHLKLTIE